tara:strand:+ start:27 stop:212 length:186 start_codon:yes stop_codon:yes gene_type:complete
MIILKDIIINYQNESETPQIRDVHIVKGKVNFIDPIEQLKNLEETIDGSPKELYEQANINN